MRINTSLYFILLLLIACRQNQATTQQPVQQDVTVTPGNFITLQGAYTTGATVELSGSLSNRHTSSIIVKEVSIKIRNISRSGTFSMPVLLKKEVVLNPGEHYVVTHVPIWTIPDDAEKDAYGIYLSYINPAGKEITEYLSFFRVTDQTQLTTFQILKERYHGLNIFRLNGGMSAEYSVEKSLENLGAGISHSWEVNSPGSGPNPVYATPAFLQKSVEQVVSTYNQTLGSSATFETIILSTGIPSIPHLSNVLKAPVLPLHFLAGCNTVKEVQSIMDYSNSHGLRSYATLGYDLSVPTAVAWIKLLDIPGAYLQFIQQHGVKNVIILGSTGTSGGETKAKQVQNDSKNIYQAGSIYLLYAGNTPDDVTTMRQKIRDFDETDQQRDYVYISDWESGVISDQIENITATIKTKTSTTLYSVTAHDMLDLYNLGTYATISHFKKNTIAIKGVVLNPYLISHPVYESRIGFIPLCYWQLIPPQSTIDRIKTTVQTAIKAIYPETAFEQLTMWVNSSNNFGGGPAAQKLISTLKANGYNNILQNDFTQDEIWNPADGMQSPAERIADVIIGSPGIFEWSKALHPLTIDDLSELSKKFQGFLVVKE